MPRTKPADPHPALEERIEEMVATSPASLRIVLDANLSDTNSEIGEKRGRSSRQAVFKGLSFLMGYCDAMGTALVLQPPEVAPRHPVRSYLLHLPCEALVRDLFVREDLCLGPLPEVTHELPGTPSELELGSVPRELLEGISTLDLASPIEQLPRGLYGASTASLPRYRVALSETFRRSGRDPSRFRGYPCLIRYPVPLVTMNWRLRATSPAGA